MLTEHSDISQVSQVREAYRQVGLDLVKLLRFVDMNATGIRKILKKFDKRFGYRFTDYYVSTRANHPYSQLQPIFKQVVMSISCIFNSYVDPTFQMFMTSSMSPNFVVASRILSVESIMKSLILRQISPIARDLFASLRRRKGKAEPKVLRTAISRILA